MRVRPTVCVSSRLFASTPSVTVKVPVYDNRVERGHRGHEGKPGDVTPTLNAVFPKAVDANLVVSASIYIIAGACSASRGA